MREPVGDLQRDSNGIATDIEEIRWLLFELGKGLLSIVKNPVLSMMLGDFRSEIYGSLAVECMEAGAGWEAMVDTYLESSNLPQELKPMMRDMMMAARDVRERLRNNQSGENHEDTPSDLPFDLPPDIKKLLNDL